MSFKSFRQWLNSPPDTLWNRKRHPRRVNTNPQPARPSASEASCLDEIHSRLEAAKLNNFRKRRKSMATLPVAWNLTSSDFWRQQTRQAVMAAHCRWNRGSGFSRLCQREPTPTHLVVRTPWAAARWTSQNKLRRKWRATAARAGPQAPPLSRAGTAPLGGSSGRSQSARVVVLACSNLHISWLETVGKNH